MHFHFNPLPISCAVFSSHFSQWLYHGTRKKWFLLSRYCFAQSRKKSTKKARSIMVWSRRDFEVGVGAPFVRNSAILRFKQILDSVRQHKSDKKCHFLSSCEKWNGKNDGYLHRQRSNEAKIKSSNLNLNIPHWNVMNECTRKKNAAQRSKRFRWNMYTEKKIYVQQKKERDRGKEREGERAAPFPSSANIHIYSLKYRVLWRDKFSQP